MGIVSHNTEEMRAWANELKNNTNAYDNLVRDLYTIMQGFAGSADFKGGLSDTLINNINRMRPFFEEYSDTFLECIKYIVSTASDIDSDTSRLKQYIENNNVGA